MTGANQASSWAALLAGYYASELLLRLLARDDPHPRLFDGYALLMHALAGPWHASPPAAKPPQPDEHAREEHIRANRAAALRAFELLPALDAATLTLAPLAAGAPSYRLSPEGGLLACDDGAEAETPALPGSCWQALEHALTAAAPFATLLAAIGQWTLRERAQLRRLLRIWLDTYSGGQLLKTRQLLHDVQAL